MKKLYFLPLMLALLPATATAAVSKTATPEIPGQTIITKSIGIDGKATIDIKSTPEKQYAQETAEKYQVKVIIDPDANGKNKTPQGVWLIKDDILSYQSMRKAENKFNVPAGDYMVQVIFTGNNDVNSILFFPDIKVEGDTELHVNADMADKTITTAFTLPSGEKAVLPEDDGTGAAADKPYNIARITADIHLTYNGISKGSVQSLVGAGGENYSDYFILKTNVDNSHGEV